MAQKVTQALIYAELQALKEMIKEHSAKDIGNFEDLRALLEGTPAVPGMKIRLDRVEQREASRQRHIGYVVAALTAIGAATVKLLVLG